MQKNNNESNNKSNKKSLKGASLIDELKETLNNHQSRS